MRVTVYGHTGTVGSQLYRWLCDRGINPTGLSLDETGQEIVLYGNSEPGEEDWAFLCLPTPTWLDGQDISAIQYVGKRWLTTQPLGPAKSVNIVIRSTVLPGTCAGLQAEHPEWRLYHWPEFLSARTAWEDFCHPKVQIVGGDRRVWVDTWADVLPLAWMVYTDTTTAEMIKYAHNCHGAMQVVFANLLWDMSLSAGGIDWETMKRALMDLRYISADTIAAYWDIYRDGYRGYGGACFPKDVNAVRHWLAGKAELLDGMAAANERLKGGS